MMRCSGMVRNDVLLVRNDALLVRNDALLVRNDALLRLTHPTLDIFGYLDITLEMFACIGFM
jgi:hypothetical protein